MYPNTDHQLISIWNGVYMFELNCPDHTLCLSKSCLQLKLSEDCKVFDAWQACSAALILLSDVHLRPCCSVSILPHFSLHLSTSLCPSLSPSFTSVCLLTPPPVLSLWGGLCWLHTVCLLPADWLTEAPTAWVMPPWQHHSGHCVCICVCKNSNLHACLHKVSTYVAGAADECLTHGYCFYWRS